MVGAAPSPAVPAPPAAVFPFAATDPFTGGHAAFPEAVPTEVVPNPVVTAAPVAAPSHGSLPEVARSPMLSKHDEFLSHLFETIHDLHFLRDALEGGEFCLSLAKDALGMEAGFVSFHNFAKREFVVACAKGERATSHLMSSVPENDGVLRQALRERRCLALNGLPDTDAGSPVRYREFSAVRSILVAPILQGMRVLGAIELVNSSHGGVFSETDSHALAYIAEQFSLYLSSRGVIVDPAKIAKASNLASAP
jgi:putative methionine-R-sulfoxide reductase with GAF domain